MIVQNMYNENSSNYNNSLRRHFNLNRHKFADAKNRKLKYDYTTSIKLSSRHCILIGFSIYYIYIMLTYSTAALNHFFTSS